jgi:hypothetical protein
MEPERQLHETREQSSSDFEDRVLAIKELDSKSTSCLEEVNALYGRFIQATPGTKEERDTVERV